jgi:two-component system nitrate/nitrite response regulator NarL
MDHTPTTAKISVMIADDHSLVRESLAQTLTNDQKFSVTTTDSYVTARAEIAKLRKIDVVLLDLVMPGMEGLKSIEDLVRLNANGAIVIFSGNATTDFIDQSLALGARGFIPKTLPLRSLAVAIQLISLGQIFVPILSGPQATKTKDSREAYLSPKESVILLHVSGGLTNKAIAWEVGIAEVTVKMHMRSICSKLKAKNRAHAVILATQLGLLQSDFHSA